MSGFVRLNGLTPRQARAVGALLEGCSLKDTARRAGVCERTVARWLEQPEFVHQLKAGESAVLERVSRRLVGVCERAVDVLAGLLEQPAVPGAGVLRLTAKDLLEITQTWREMSNFEERLSALEQAVLHEK